MTTPKILIDSNSSHFSAPQDWTVFWTGSNLGGSVLRSNAANGTEQFVDINVTFEGTSMTLYVFSPFTHTEPEFLPVTVINIDGKDYFTIPVPAADVNVVTGEEDEQFFFQTPQLEDTSHTVLMKNFPSILAIDYATVSPGSQTQLQAGETILVDDSDISIDYYWPVSDADVWTIDDRNASFSPLNFTWSVTTYGNTTHHSDVRAASANFTFNGTAVATYGVLPAPSDPGKLVSISVTHILDGFSTNNVQNSSIAEDVQMNYLWFSNSSLSAGEHTLTIVVEDTINAPFYLDYITYTPLPGSFLSSSTGSTQTRSNRTTLIGAIVGSLVGVLALVFVWWFLVRRNKSRSSHETEGEDVIGNGSDRASHLVTPFPSDYQPREEARQGLEKTRDSNGAIPQVITTGTDDHPREGPQRELEKPRVFSRPIKVHLGTLQRHDGEQAGSSSDIPIRRTSGQPNAMNEQPEDTIQHDIPSGPLDTPESYAADATASVISDPPPYRKEDEAMDPRFRQ